MSERRQLFYGGVPVPYSASWSAEEATLHVSECAWANQALAVCQEHHRGVGKPVFGKPHMTRQREVVVSGLCDMCARPLRSATKVSLSHARLNLRAAEGATVLQVEPLLHRHCAAISLNYCPSLRRDIKHGTLQIRRVQRSRVQFAQLKPESVAEFTGGEPIAAIGHAKVELLQWIRMTEEWLQEGIVAQPEPDKTYPMTTKRIIS